MLAANKYGVGQPCESEPVIIKNQFTVPRAPGKPKLAGATADSITVTWDRPSHDGDDPVEQGHAAHEWFRSAAKQEQLRSCPG